MARTDVADVRDSAKDTAVSALETVRTQAARPARRSEPL